MTISGFPKVESTIPDLGSPHVNPVTGELTLCVRDYGQRDMGETFFFERTYVCGRIREGKSHHQSLGSRWILGFDGSIERNGTNLRLPIGEFRWEAFCFQDNRWVHCKDEARYQLREKQDGFQLRDLRIPAEYFYDKKGHLISIQKKGGFPRSIRYYGNFPVTITLCGGNRISLGFDGSLLTSMRDSIGRSLSFEYEAGLLKRVIYPNNADIKYEYDDRSRLISCTDRTGKKSFFVEYDFYGRVARLEQGNGDRYTYRYAEQDRRTIILNENTLEYQTYYWNFRNQVVRIIFENGEEELRSYDEAGRVVYQRYASGKEIHRTYNEISLITREEYSDGQTIEYEYDKLGRRTRKHDNFDGEEQYKWNENGWLVEKLTRLTGHAWSRERWERDMVGRVLVYSRNGNRTSYAYAEKAALPHLMELPCGGKFSYKYDDVGRLLLILSEFGERTFGYNVLDLVARDTDPLGYQQEYRYDLQGNSIDGTIPSEQSFPGSGKKENKDTVRKDIYEANPEFLCSYDPKGRLTEVRRKTDRMLIARYQYDIGGRITEERAVDDTGKDGDGALWLKRWKYDDNDNVVEERCWINPQDETGTRGRIYILRNEYDAQDRRIVSEDNEGSRIEYEYDSLNCCIMRKRRERKQLIEVRKYIYDAAGRLIASDEKSDYEKTGKLWERTEFLLNENGQCLKVFFSDGTEATGKTAYGSYQEFLEGIPYYEDVSGYCKTQADQDGKNDER